MSNIKFSGRIWKDPVMRCTPNGKYVLNWELSLYTGKNEKGEYNQSVVYDIEAWNDLGERLQNELKDKMVITVEGMPRPPRKYTDKETGVEKYARPCYTAFRVAIGDEFQNTPAEDCY